MVLPLSWISCSNEFSHGSVEIMAILGAEISICSALRVYVIWADKSRSIDAIAHLRRESQNSSASRPNMTCCPSASAVFRCAFVMIDDMVNKLIKFSPTDGVVTALRAWQRLRLKMISIWSLDSKLAYSFVKSDVLILCRMMMTFELAYNFGWNLRTLWKPSSIQVEIGRAIPVSYWSGVSSCTNWASPGTRAEQSQRTVVEKPIKSIKADKVAQLNRPIVLQSEL